MGSAAIFIRSVLGFLCLTKRESILPLFRIQSQVNQAALHDIPSLGLDLAPPLSPIGPKWKEERRLFHAHIGKDAMRHQYSPVIEMQAQKYALRFIGAERTISSDYLK